jgi:circadian clock protein KaiB
VKRASQFKFRLYVAGQAPNSVLAVTNLLALCRSCLSERHEIEIIDVLREPKLALANGILMTPTLVKLAPGPGRTIIGTLSETETVKLALGLETVAA